MALSGSFSRMLRGWFMDPLGNKLYVVVKLTHRDRNIVREKEMYEAVQEEATKKKAACGRTGCVRMLPSPNDYLTVEDFGTDIRKYFDPESGILLLNLKKLIGAVKSFHDLGYAHCDLKPDNILVKEVRSGVFEFKLCDLENATRLGEEFQQLGKFTLAWVSPEMYFHRYAMAFASFVRLRFLIIVWCVVHLIDLHCPLCLMTFTLFFYAST